MIKILFRQSLPALMAFMIAPAAAQVDTSRQAALDYIGRGRWPFATATSLPRSANGPRRPEYVG
jgi:hypothetical protein